MTVAGRIGTGSEQTQERPGLARRRLQDLHARHDQTGVGLGEGRDLLDAPGQQHGGDARLQRRVHGRARRLDAHDRALLAQQQPREGTTRRSPAGTTMFCPLGGVDTPWAP